MGVITYLYVKLFYFIGLTALYATLALYLLWGVDVDPLLVKSAPPALGFVTSFLIPNPNLGGGRIRKLVNNDKKRASGR